MSHDAAVPGKRRSRPAVREFFVWTFQAVSGKYVVIDSYAFLRLNFLIPLSSRHLGGDHPGVCGSLAIDAG